MTINLNTAIKIIKLNKKNNTKVINYLHKPGIIAGRKKINKQFSTHIIEFQDYTRIWFFTRELKLITYKNQLY